MITCSPKAADLIAKHFYLNDCKSVHKLCSECMCVCARVSKNKGYLELYVITWTFYQGLKKKKVVSLRVNTPQE